jgi:nucleotide-binding universal stress UspA family protein
VIVMPTVLVPLDGSDKDARALPVAMALATLSGADVHLVHVIGPSPYDVRTEHRDVAEGDVPGHSEAAQRLAAVAHRLAPDGGCAVTWEVLAGADVPAELTRRAAVRDALVVVMATRAARPLDRALVGSVADRVLRECPTPVALVPPGAGYVQGRRLRFTRVLVPLDGSALAAHALDFLLRLSRADTLEYVLLEVVPHGRDRARAERRLADAAGRVRARGTARAEVVVLEAGDPARAIIALLRDALIDVIAMSTRGQSGLRRMMLGSVAEAVLRASEVPVLLLTPASLASLER